MKWEKALEPDCNYYIVYRDGKRHDTAVQNSYSDGLIIDGHTYGYQISTMDVHENESQRCDEVTISYMTDIYGDQMAPAIIAAKDQNYVVTYVDQRNNSSNIYGQRYSANGEKIGIKFKANDTPLSAAQIPNDMVKISASADGSFVIAWENNKKIFAQRFDASGNRIGNNFKVSDGIEPAIAMSSNGSYMIVYRSGGYPVMGKLYANLQDISGKEFTISHIMEYHRNPAIVAFPTGGFVVTWEAEVSMGVIRIYAQRYDANGNEIGRNFRVDDDPEHYWKYSPAVTATADGSFIIVWDDYRGSDYGIFGQRFDSSGNKRGKNFKINDHDANPHPKTPAVAMNSKGDEIVTWVDYRNSNADIYAQRYSSNGTRDGVNYRVNVDTETADQIFPDVFYQDDVIYHVWQDQHAPDQGWNIAQRLENVNFVFWETFNDYQLNEYYWQIIPRVNAYVAQQNQQLEFRVVDYVEARVESRFLIRGDFDIVIEFNVQVNSDGGNGIYFSAFDQDNNYSISRHYNAGWRTMDGKFGHIYLSNFDGDYLNGRLSTSADDSTGILRLTRQGNVITSNFMRNGYWVTLLRKSGSNDDLAIGISLSTYGGTRSLKGWTDNFKVIKGEIVFKPKMVIKQRFVLPAELRLEQNYPNPFNQATEIS